MYIYAAVHGRLFYNTALLLWHIYPASTVQGEVDEELSRVYL